MYKVKTKNKQSVKLEGWTTGLHNFEPMELSKWDEQPDISQYNTIQWAALRYAAIAFLSENAHHLDIDVITNVDDYNAFSGGALYLNDFEGYNSYSIFKAGINFSRVTYTTDGRIIIVGYELTDDIEKTEKEHAWLLG